jgi:secondary thiamine-phosphate synthase enzyme
VDLTEVVEGGVRRSGVENGIALVYSPHTTCAVVINEKESGFIADFEDDDHEAPNGHAHLRHVPLGSASQAIPVIDRSLQLGCWQRVFFVELDRARDRRVLIQVMGE